MSITLSLRTEEEVVSNLDRLAEALDRNRNWIINEAITQFIDLHAWQLEQIKKGVADSDAGRTISTDQLLDRIGKLAKRAGE